MNKLHLDELSGLPGEEIIRPGLIDFEQKKVTLEALLVAIASNRLRNYGLPNCDDTDIPEDAEIQLYHLLA